MNASTLLAYYISLNLTYLCFIVSYPIISSFIFGFSEQYFLFLFPIRFFTSFTFGLQKLLELKTIFETLIY